jgi:hypothetical protein
MSSTRENSSAGHKNGISSKWFGVFTVWLNQSENGTQAGAQ